MWFKHITLTIAMFLPDTCDDPICSCLEQKDLLNYSLVCKDTLRAVRAYSSCAFRLCHSLRKFMSEESVMAFRSVMRRTGTVISGSVAIHYFARTSVGDSDLDLYTEGRHARELFDFIHHLGYVYKPRESQEKALDDALIRAVNQFAVRDEAIYNQSAILDAFSFIRGPAIIQVMVVFESAVDAILDFHSTVVMNVITFRSAHSFFPYNTFINKTGVRFINDVEDGPIQKYTQQGWRLRRTVTTTMFEHMGMEMSGAVRYVGDPSTWTIDLDKTSAVLPDPILFNSWQMHWTMRPGVLTMPEIRRLLYVGPRRWSQSRVFATSDLVKSFTKLTMDKRSEGHTDDEVLSFVIESAKYSLFQNVPPSATDTAFYDDWVRTRPNRPPIVNHCDDVFIPESNEIGSVANGLPPRHNFVAPIPAQDDNQHVRLVGGNESTVARGALPMRVQADSSQSPSRPLDDPVSPPRKRARLDSSLLHD
ncbi:hypothetical protein EV714DRAFT_267155 [Schizophyllum commune]